MSKKEEILNQLEGLVRESGYWCALAIMVMTDLSVDVHKILEIDWRSRISFREFSLLYGLLVKQPFNRDVPDFETLNRHTNSTYTLLHQLHESYGEPFRDHMKSALETKEQQQVDVTAGENLKKIFGQGDWMTEPIFYGGYGAYGFQFLDMAKKRYKFDAEWLATKKHISVEAMAALASELMILQERKALEFPIPQNPTYEDACRKALSVLSFQSSELGSVNAETRRSFLDIFSLIPGGANKGFNYPGSYNQVESHPLIKLGDDEYFLPIWFNLAQSIYESPFYWMRSDSQYKEEAFRHRGETTEGICYDLLKNVCGPHKVFKDVKISRSKGKTVTDADVLALLGNKAIVVQAKSKKLTELARQGDEEKLKSDFKEGVQKAYEQGLACRGAILGDSVEFISDTGEKIQIHETVNDAYLLCVLSDEYPALIHQVEAYLSKKSSDPHPVVINLFDLEIITHYLNDPFELFYYVRQRTALANYFRGEEMSLLAQHLKHKLHPAPNVDFVYLDHSMAQLIDANYPVARGYQVKTEASEKLTHQWRNPGFETLLSHVKRAQHPGVTDGVFFLLDLSSDSADTLMSGIEKIKSKARERDRVQVFTMSLDQGNSGTSVVAIPRAQAGEIEQRTLAYAMARKYELRAERWLGIGCVIGSADTIDTVVYSSKPWEKDPALEEMADVLKSSGVPLNKEMKRIGRNDPCYCGSGKKYKKCHLK